MFVQYNCMFLVSRSPHIQARPGTAPRRRNECVPQCIVTRRIHSSVVCRRTRLFWHGLSIIESREKKNIVSSLSSSTETKSLVVAGAHRQSLLPSYPKRHARFDNFNVAAAAAVFFFFIYILFVLFALACCKNINPVVLISSHFQLERECEVLRCLHLLLLCTIIIARPTTAEYKNTYKFTFISHSVTFYSSCALFFVVLFALVHFGLRCYFLGHTH